MKIVFLCGSMEPGRDGVGDYTRRLTAELVRGGHECRVIALNDRFAGMCSEHTQESDGVSIGVLRLASSASWSNRIKQARQRIAVFSPDWVSLQFVPYSFHPKGLPLLLCWRLGRLAKDAKWHVMFHELWIGMDTTSSWRQRIVGSIQKRLVKGVLDSLFPYCIHTQTTLYLDLIRSWRSDVRLLPLFGNIPCIGRAQINSAKGEDFSQSSLTFVVFGSIHQGAPIEYFSKDAASFASEQNVGMRMVFLGRNGSGKDAWSDSWKRHGLEVVDVGECSPEEVSEWLSKSTFGIVSTPALLVEKSGSFAAMREHGLPVICVAPQWNLRSGFTISSSLKIPIYHSGSFGESIKRVDSGVNPGISTIAEQFLNDLNNNRS